jgi:hypothetical protein
MNKTLSILVLLTGVVVYVVGGQLTQGYNAGQGSTLVDSIAMFLMLGGWALAVTGLGFGIRAFFGSRDDAAA